MKRMHRTTGRVTAWRWALAAILSAGGLVSSSAQAAVVVRTAVNYRPVARAVVATAAVATTAVVVGSVVRSLPPSCSSVVVGGVAYQQCGSTWYQPQYAGSTVNYVVVNPPR